MQNAITANMKEVQGYQSGMFEITPNHAAELLKRNTHNRKIRPGAVAKYKTEIISGEWRAIPAGIGFDEDGILIDGQHRLAAIVEANLPAVLLVVTGFPRASQEKCDRHTKRSIADVFHLAGYEFDDKALAAATFLTRIWKGGIAQDNHYRTYPADCEIKAIMDRYGDSLNAMSVAHKSGEGVVFMRRAGCLAAMGYWHKNEPARANEFKNHVIDGTAPSRDFPTATLLRSFNTSNWNCASFGSGQQYEDFSRTMFAISAFRDGKKILNISRFKGALPWPI